MHNILKDSFCVIYLFKAPKTGLSLMHFFLKIAKPQTKTITKRWMGIALTIGFAFTCYQTSVQTPS